MILTKFLAICTQIQSIRLHLPRFNSFRLVTNWYESISSHSVLRNFASEDSQGIRSIREFVCRSVRVRNRLDVSGPIIVVIATSPPARSHAAQTRSMISRLRGRASAEATSALRRSSMISSDGSSTKSRRSWRRFAGNSSKLFLWEPTIRSRWRQSRMMMRPYPTSRMAMS